MGNDAIILQEYAKPVQVGGASLARLNWDDSEWLTSFSEGKKELIDFFECLQLDSNGNCDGGRGYQTGQSMQENAKSRKSLASRIKVTSDREGIRTIKADGICGWLTLPSGRRVIIRSKLSSKDNEVAFGTDIGLHWLMYKALGIRSDLYPLPTELGHGPAWDYPLLPIIQMFANTTEDLLRQGLHRHYMEEVETGPRVRGRIAMAATMLLHARGRTDLVTCIADDHTADVFENRALYCAVRAAGRLVRVLTGGGDDWSDRLGVTLNRIGWELEEVVSQENGNGREMAAAIRRRLGALPWSLERYRKSLRWAALILDLCGSDDGNGQEYPAMLIDMPKLYEVGLRAALGGEKPKPRGMGFIGGGHRMGLSPVADIASEDFVQSKAGWVADAKYYRSPMTSSNTAHAAHVYQANMYASLYSRPCALVYAWGPGNTGQGDHGIEEQDESSEMSKDERDLEPVSKSYSSKGPPTEAVHYGLTWPNGPIGTKVGIFVMDLSTSGDGAESSFGKLDGKAKRLREELDAWA